MSSTLYLDVINPGALLVLLQVWENTPGFGEAPFLDTLWSAIDEVIICAVVHRSSNNHAPAAGVSGSTCRSSSSSSSSNTSSQQQVLLSSTEQQRFLWQWHWWQQANSLVAGKHTQRVAVHRSAIDVCMLHFGAACKHITLHRSITIIAISAARHFGREPCPTAVPFCAVCACVLRAAAARRLTQTTVTCTATSQTGRQTPLVRCLICLQNRFY
jgi:hypothetical protein